MIHRRIRNTGVRLIEAALTKLAAPPIAPFNPTLGTLKGQMTRKLKGPATSASADVPKVLSMPTS
jgi:hypothetical protein